MRLIVPKIQYLNWSNNYKISYRWNITTLTHILNLSESSHPTVYCMLIYILCCSRGMCYSDNLKEAQQRWCRGEVYPPKGTRRVKEGERFPDIQVLLNIGLTAKSLNSWEQIIHSQKPACAPLPRWATVWCCCTFPESKWGRGAEAMSSTSPANEDTGGVYKIHQRRRLNSYSRSNIQ